MSIQTLRTIEIGGEFKFYGSPKEPLQIGSVVKIHNFQEPVYGEARVVEVLGEVEYKAVRVQ